MKLAPWNVCGWGTAWSTAVPNTMERPMCHIPHSGDTITISSPAQLEMPHTQPQGSQCSCWSGRQEVLAAVAHECLFAPGLKGQAQRQ